VPSTRVGRSPGMPALLVVTCTGFSGYAALLAVAPLWAVRGGADEVGAGLVNAVLLLSTVAAQPFVPWALARFGRPAVIGAGLAFLGLPSLGYGLSDALVPVLAMSALRGVGFAVLTVTGSAIVALLVPAARLGAAIGVYGLGIALPMLLWLPASVPIADGLGFWAVFALGALPLLGIPAAGPLDRAVTRNQRPPSAMPDPPAGSAGTELAGTAGAPPPSRPEGTELAATAGTPPSSGPAGTEPPAGTGSAPAAPAAGHVDLLRRVGPAMVILLTVTLSGGALMTFLPQLVPSSGLAALSLLVLSLAAALSRWRAGSLADRAGPKPFLVPLLLLTAVGMAGVAGWVHRSPPAWALLLAVAVVGVGYGALQNLTLLVAFQAVSRDRVNQASAAWNMGFDAGTGVGALVTGYLAAGFSFPAAFGVLAAVCATATLAVRAVAGQAR
jgi:MFS family permease